MTTKIDSHLQINDHIDAKTKVAHYEDVDYFTADLQFIAPPACEVTPVNIDSVPPLKSVLLLEAKRQLFKSSQLKEKAVKNHEKKLGRKLTPKEFVNLNKHQLWDFLSPQQQHSLLYNISTSSVNRPDIEGTVTVNGKEFKTVHQFRHNSPLNGKAYLTPDGRTVEITHAIAASQDKNSTEMQMLRRISQPDNTTLAYTGRPETQSKAEDQAKWLFEQERKSKGKGITQVGREDELPIYEFTYVIDSLLSASFLYHLVSQDECAIIEGEKKALETLRSNEQGYIVVDPQTGKECRVRFKPILLQNPINRSYEIDRALPEPFSGYDIEKVITQKGFEQLREYAKQYRKGLPSTENIDRALKLAENFKSYKPEEKIIVLAMLAEACHLPLVLHCMSSKDRTAMAIALISAFNQYREQGLFTTIEAMLKDEPFKELFLANLMIGHKITNYGIGAEGEFWGEELEKLCGFVLDGNQTLIRLMPQRYVTGNLKPLKAILATPLIVIGALLFAVAGFVERLIRACQQRSLKPLGEHYGFWFFVDFARFVARAHELIPSLVLKKDIPGFAQRNFKKMKETHPLSPSMKACAETIAGLSDLDYERLLSLFQKENPTPHGLSEKERGLILYLSEKRNDLEKMLEIGVLEKQLPKRTKRFIATALQWKMLRFDTTDRATQLQIIDFFQSGGSWNVKLPGHEIANGIRPYLKQGLLDEAAIEDQFNKDWKRDTITLIDGQFVPMEYGDNPFQKCLEHLLRKGIAKEDALRLLCACQQGGHMKAQLLSMELFSHFMDREQIPQGGVMVYQDQSSIMRANILTSEKKIVLTTPFVFRDENQKELKFWTFENTVDVATDTASGKFTITDSRPFFKYTKPKKPPEPIAVPVIDNEYRVVKAWRWFKDYISG